jgi:hypothetical protein
MATLGNTVLTLADWAKRLDPDGQVPTIVELLSQTNEIIQDQLFMEGNLPTGHRVTVRTSLPTVAWRLLNQGVTPSKSTSAQADEQAGMLEAYSEVDKDLAELNGNSASFRLSEAQAFLEAMNQEYAQTLVYGNSGIAPEEFTGLAPRYALSTGVTGQNVIKAGGSGSDNSSIYLVAWGANTVFGVFPKGSKAGLIHEDLGLVTVQGATGIGTSRMRAYQDHWQWKAGLVVRDWRYVVRIANIDISNLVAESSAADLIKVMLRAIHRLPSQTLGRPIFYANRTILEMLDIQAMQKANLYLTVGQEEGQRKVSLRGIPIRLVDQLLETEATVA